MRLDPETTRKAVALAGVFVEAVPSLNLHTEEIRLRWSEKQFMAAVIELAKSRGFKTYHTHNSRRSEPGFPDLVLTIQDRCLFMELKTEKGKLTQEQRDWVKALEDAGQRVYVLRPSNWDLIEDLLK